ncbi:hypothetical protein NUW58_g3242 [Xylaria curta]|uniref:Uncharacterized protein n=1 Tax=Xylaria curta TaxID=42375 RepID=A0ACC1PD23_9PEZI|nr:hypothetical protein NUW58_g3242 [Xylaria curta]
MQPLSSLIALLAATIIALPAPMAPRQLGGLPGLGAAAGPITTILSQVGKHVPGAVGKLQGGLQPQGNKNSTRNMKDEGPLGGLGGLGGVLGGVVRV